MIPKFRAWSIKRKKYYRVVSISFKDNDLIDKIEVEGDSTYPCLKPKNLTLEQSTGLKDKNGVEIFEGDKVKSDLHNPAEMWIEYRKGGYCALYSDEAYPIDINHFYPSGGCCFEVIGNIHEQEKS